MDVMPAGMHHARFLGTVRDIVLLLDWQGVNIRPHGNSRRPWIGGFDNFRDDAPLARGHPMRNSGGGKLFA